MPGLAVYNARSINDLACKVAKGLNPTSAVIYELLLDLRSYHKAVLQNTVAIYYLLLKHNYGVSILMECVVLIPIPDNHILRHGRNWLLTLNKMFPVNGGIVFFDGFQR